MVAEHLRETGGFQSRFDLRRRIAFHAFDDPLKPGSGRILSVGFVADQEDSAGFSTFATREKDLSGPGQK